MARPKASKPPLDKERLEFEYRAGVKSLRQLAAEFGVSAPRVVQIAKEDGWERDLTIRIKAEAQAKLNRAALNAELNAELNKETRKATEREVIEKNADLQAAVVLEHRADARRNRAIVTALVAELEALTGNKDLFGQLGEILDDGNTEKAREAFNRAIGFAARVDSAKKLAETMRILIAIERQAFGIKDDENSGGGRHQIEDIVRQIEAEDNQREGAL